MLGESTLKVFDIKDIISATPKDLTFLTSQWNKIREATLKSEAPKLIYEEGNILKRTIRDMLTEEVDNILVEGKDGFEKIKKLTKNLVPSKTKKIKLYKSKDKSLFSDSTALKTNLEAAVEIARQLRLRDLGGLVVIDFIDMEDYRNNFKVEKTIKTALHRDRARVQVGRISMFGLLELSRQRLRSSLIEKSFEKCPYCNGSGLILNPHSIAEQIIKVIKFSLAYLYGIQLRNFQLDME